MDFAVATIADGFIAAAADAAATSGVLPQDVIHISTADALSKIGGPLNKDNYYVLDNNISAGAWTPIDDFQGTLDGQGYSVTNLSVSATQYAGLFGRISSSGVTIKNLGVSIGANGIIANNSNGTAHAGGLVACIESNSTTTIENCYVTGHSSKSGTGSNSAAYDISAYADSPAYPSARVGGLVGTSPTSSTIINCYVRASVHANSSGQYASSYAGGLVGYGSGYAMLISCYATGNVYSRGYSASTSNAGALVGLSNNNNYDCFYLDSQIVDGSEIIAGTKISADTLRFIVNQLNVNDPNGVWKIPASSSINNGYPVFKDYYRLTGKVASNDENDEIGKNGIGSALIEVFDAGGEFVMSATTDSSGSFSIPRVRELRQYTINASAEGYLANNTYILDMPSQNHSMPNSIMLIPSTMINVSDVVGRPGEEITIEVGLENNPGIASYGLSLQYDTTRLQYVDSFEGDIHVGNFRKVDVADNIIRFTAYHPDGAIVDTGTILFTVVLKITSDDEGIVDGEDFLFGYFNKIQDNFAVSGTEVIEIPVSQGAITIRKPFYGDVNGNGVLNRADQVRLNLFFSDPNESYDNFVVANADVNGDGVLNRADQVRLNQFFSGIDEGPLGPEPQPNSLPIAFSMIGPLNVDEPRISISEGHGIAGDDVTITVMLENNPGIASYGLSLQYDTTRLEYVGSNEGDIRVGNFRKVDVAENIIRFTAYHPDGEIIYGGTTLFTATFKIEGETDPCIIEGEDFFFGYFNKTQDNFALSGTEVMEIPVTQGKITVVDPSEDKAITGYAALAAINLDINEEITTLAELKASGKLPTQVTVTDGTTPAAADITNWAGIFDGAAVGEYTLTATWIAPNGYVNSNNVIVTITVNVCLPFVPVTDITGVPTEATAGYPLVLTGVLVPDNATNKAIVWSIDTANTEGATGATLSGDTLLATAAGTVVVTATIIDGIDDGKDFKKDFSISVHQSDTDPLLSVSSSLALRGTAATVDISIANNPGFAGMVLKVSYPEELELVQYALGDVGLLSGFTGPDGIAPGEACSIPDSFYLVWGRDSDYTQDGTIFTLTFEVSPDAEPVEYPIVVTFEQHNGPRIPVDYQEQPLDISINNGAIIVISYILGNVTDSGEVGPADLVRLARWIAGYDVSINKRAADINGDCEIGPSDLVRLARWIAGHFGGLTLEELLIK